MKRNKHFFKITAISAVLLLCAVLLCSCFVNDLISRFTDTEKHEEYCEDFIDCVLDDDSYTAYKMVSQVASTEEFDTLWTVMRETLSGCEDYELSQTSVKINTYNGVTSTTVGYEMTTDTKKVCQITVTLTENVDGISGFWFHDSTPFIKSTSFIPYLNIAFIFFSLLMTALVIWMVIDCIKRKMKKKPLWILLILLGFSFTFTIGASGLNLNFSFLLAVPLSSIKTIVASSAIAVKSALPLGAIIYFFLRKKLTLPKELPCSQSEESAPCEMQAAPACPATEDPACTVVDEPIKDTVNSEETDQTDREEPKL